VRVPPAGDAPLVAPLLDLRGAPAPLPATAALSWSAAALEIAFEVGAEPPLLVDRSPAWANDCVEAFLAPDETPWEYLELVLDAAGGGYAARVHNPDGDRATWKLQPTEPPQGLVARVRGEGSPEARTRWSATLSVPWSAIGVVPSRGARLRGNLFRIARGRSTRHLALSPTFRTDPPEFHVPSAFATIELL
jgi:hypothetical protein